MTTATEEATATEPGEVPVAEAFELAQEKLGAATPPEQQQLPGVVLPFNFQAAYLELEAKAVEVDRLHDEHKAAAESARDAKKAWDAAAELYTRMALELRRRRRAKEGAPAEDLLDESEREPATNLVRCKWEEQHPGEPCPVCANPEAQGFDAPRNSEAHVDEVTSLLNLQSCTAVGDALDAIGLIVDLLTIARWSEDDRATVKAWAECDRSVSDAIPPRPAILGTGHIASTYVENQSEQFCTECGATLIAAPAEGETPNYYTPGIFVGTDCQGKGQHYPKRGRRKKSAE